MAGKTVVLTTTNGTLALCHGHLAAEVLPAALVNLSAVCRHLFSSSPAGGSGDIDVLCAGTDGQVTREDVLAAGAIVERIARDGAWQLDDQSLIARDAWRAVVGESVEQPRIAQLEVALRDSRGGRNLAKIGMADDIARAAQVDRYNIVATFDAGSRLVTIAGDG